jgi:hypothetical protein
MESQDEKPKLESMTFNFSQESNCVDSGDVEELEIRCESSLGIDNDGGYFYILKTDGWAVDSVEDLQKLFDRIQKSIKNE